MKVDISEKNRIMETENTKAPRLEMTPGGLALCSGELKLLANFRESLPRLKENNLGGELVVKAARGKNFSAFSSSGERPVLIDATAGLGEDSVLLAAAGFEVELFEKDEVIAALLEDALLRAAADPELSGTVSHMHLHKEDSIEAMASGKLSAQVVYLDPMFPGRTKSGLVGKKFQLLHGLEKPCENGAELIDAAKRTGTKKIIVKRPLKAETLGGLKPSYQLKGKAIRMDVYVL